MGKFLDKAGVGQLWAKVKEQDAKVIKENVTDKLGAAGGIATLGSDSKLTASQLPALKTVNGESVVGSGNIEIDLSLYQVVAELPKDNINSNKIYLILSTASGEANKYTEYAYINNTWEKFGEYEAALDLDGYLEKDKLDEEVQKLNYVKFSDVASAAKAGVIKLNYVTNDKKYKVQVDAEGNAFVEVPWVDNDTEAEVVNSNPTLEWGKTSQIGTVDGEKLEVTMPANPNTDESVTSAANHYTPQTEAYTPTAGSAVNWEGVVVTGITKDSKGHIVGVTTGTIPSQPTPGTTDEAITKEELDAILV